ncbi:MAG: phospholipase D family protein [Actinomycetales bacterium]
MTDPTGTLRAAHSWFLSPQQRGNPATGVDRRHPGSAAFSRGNSVRPLIHGEEYFPALRAAVQAQRPGDLLLFTDWRGDPDERLGQDSLTIVQLFSQAAARGVVVKGLFWRSHWDRLAYSVEQNRSMSDDIRAAGGEVLLDMRVRPLGSHHQKFVVLRHPGREHLDVAFVGGIDLCHTRHDSAQHHGDPQPVPMAPVWSARPPWHDAQVMVQGPAVGDIEYSFRERWNDPHKLAHDPVTLIDDTLHRDERHPQPMPPQGPDPQPVGTAAVQVLRTYPAKRPRYPFAPLGERSIARAYDKAVGRAHGLVYLEDQYFWNPEVISCFAQALRAQPELRMILVLTAYAAQAGRLSSAANLISRTRTIAEILDAGGDRVGVYSIENRSGTPVYVHSKVCVVDDVWASVGSDNMNRRSWTHDSELTCAVVDEALDEREPHTVDGFGDGARVFARNLRLALAAEHLDRDLDDPSDIADLLDPVSCFEAFARQAAQVQAWHEAGRGGPRPPGRLRPYRPSRYTGIQRVAAEAVYRFACDPDGRPWRMRLRPGSRF